MRLLFLGLAVSALSACASLPAPFNQSPFETSPSAAATTPAVDANGAPVALPLTRQQQELADAERRLFAQGQEQGLGTAMAGSMDQTDGFVVRSGSILTSASVSELNSPNAPVFAQTDRIYVSNDNSMGMTSGRYVQVRTGAEALLGRYSIVWRKDVNGQWRVLSESRTPDPVRTVTASTTPPATLTTRR